jgi:hypothetical protein
MPVSSGTRAVLPQNLGCTRVTEHTVSMSRSIGIRVYSDTNPKVWRTSELQKGLVFVYNDAERIGEATGFGVPIIKSSDETYFSGSSSVYLQYAREATTIYKEYYMDRLARNAYRNIRLENRQMRSMLERFSDLYQRNKRSRFPMLMLKRVPMKIGISSSFVKTAPLGRAVVTYKIRENRILVEADFTRLKKPIPEKIFMMNEQGTSFFRGYRDSCGKQLVDEQAGAWDQVKADWATITNTDGNVGFCLRKVNNSILRMGREFQDGYLDWIGLDYEVDPRTKTFSYEIEVLGA